MYDFFQQLFEICFQQRFSSKNELQTVDQKNTQQKQNNCLPVGRKHSFCVFFPLSIKNHQTQILCWGKKNGKIRFRTKNFAAKKKSKAQILSKSRYCQKVKSHPCLFKLTRLSALLLNFSVHKWVSVHALPNQSLFGTKKWPLAFIFDVRCGEKIIVKYLILMPIIGPKDYFQQGSCRRLHNCCIPSPWYSQFTKLPKYLLTKQKSPF